MMRWNNCKTTIDKIARIDQLIKKMDDGDLKDIISEYQEHLKTTEIDSDKVDISDRYEEIMCCMGPDGAYHEITAYAKTGRYTKVEMTEKFINYIIDKLDVQEINYTKYLVVSWMDGERETLTPMKDLVKLIMKDMKITNMPGGTTMYVYCTEGTDRYDLLEGED